MEAPHKTPEKIGPLLSHVGMLRQPDAGPYPEANSDSPSGRTHTGTKVRTEPNNSEVAGMVTAHTNAAEDATRLGFNCAEIHGALGYLIDEFFGVL